MIVKLVELKRGAENLSPDEREELAAHLKLLRLMDNPAWKKEMSRRMREMDAGKKVTQQQFERMIGLHRNK
jgi:hypothetical protein